MKKKGENRHSGCPYRECCTKEDKWCPFLKVNGVDVKDYEYYHLFKEVK